MTLNFIRKLKLLKKMYIQLPKLQLLTNQNNFSISLSSIIESNLWLVCLSNAKLNRLFKNILFQLLTEDSSIKINGKALLQLQTVFCSNDLEQIFKKIPSQQFQLGSILAKYSAEELIHHLQLIYFKKIKSKYFLDIDFLSSFEVIPEIEMKLSNLSIENYLPAAINYTLPITQQVINFLPLS